MGALSGLKVADFSWVGAGPRATKDLADNGATVVKIESRKRLDLGRLSPPFKDNRRHHDASAFFAQTNTGKYSVSINLSDPRGVAVARRLVAWSDVVVENFSKGYLDRIGLGYAHMQELRPGIILASVSVAGRDGPLSAIRGYGNSAAARSGQAALAGWPGEAPHMPPFAYGDVVAPMFATVGILAALERRRVTGEGGHLDISQVEPLIHTLSDVYAVEQVVGPDPDRRGNRDPFAAPHGVFPCRGHDQWCAIVVENEAQWRQFRMLMGASAPTGDERFATPTARHHNEAALATIVAGWTASQDKHELAQILRTAGIPAGAVQDGRDVFTDPELRRAGHFVRVDHPVLGGCDMPAPPMRLGHDAIEIRPSPLLGEHNDLVLGDWLGISAQERTALAEEGVLA